MSGRWILRVDPSACRCNAMCVAVAPDLFTLAGTCAQPSMDVIDDTLLDIAEEAHALCPTQAITIAPLTQTERSGS